jgi:hypothetical protein
MSDDSHIATHEAGHAVIARVLGLPVTRIGLDIEKCRMPLDHHKYPAGARGICYTIKTRRVQYVGERFPSATRTRAEAEEAHAVSCAAGCAAEEIVHGHHEHGDGTDLESIAECLETAGNHHRLKSTTGPDVHAIMETARALCLEHKDKIVAVADALQERGHLDGDELEDLAFPARR